MKTPTFFKLLTLFSMALAYLAPGLTFSANDDLLESNTNITNEQIQEDEKLSLKEIQAENATIMEYLSLPGQGKDLETEEKNTRIQAILKSYEDKIQNDPHNLKLILAIADVYYSLHDYNQAIKYYRQALDLDLHNFNIKLALAKSYLNKKDLSHSQELFTELYKVEPSNPDVLGGLGRIEALKKNTTQAEILYSKSLTIDPKNFSTLFYIAELRINQKRFGEAIEILEQLHENDPKANWIKDALIRAQLGPILEEGKKLEEKGDFKSALAIYNQQLKNNPDDVDLHIALSQFYARSGNYSKAINILMQSIKRHPNENALLLALGLIYLEKRDLSHAKSFLELVDKSENGQSDARAGLGRIAELNGNIEQAEEIYLNAAQLDPFDTLPLSYLANLRMTQKKYDEAIQLLEKIYLIDPNAKWALQLIEEAKIAPVLDEIDLLKKNNQDDKADQLYRQLISQYPNNVLNYLYFGQFYLNKKLYQNAIEVYQLGVKYNPDNMALYVALGNGYLLNNAFNDSLQTFHFVLDHDPYNKDALTGIGKLNATIGDIQESADIYRLVLKSNPKDIMALSYLADLEFQQKNYEEAQKLYKTILKINPKANWALQSLLRTKYAPLFNEIKELESQGLLDEAILKYQNLMELAPNSEHAYFGLAQLYTSQKRYAEALHIYKMRLKNEPNSNELRVNVALTYLQMGNLKKANEILLLANKADPRNADAIAGLGRIAALSKDIPNAVKMYKKALEINPNSISTLSYYGELLLSQKEFSKAEQIYKKIVELNPEAIWALDALQEAKHAPLLQKIREKEESNELKQTEELYLQLISEAPEQIAYYIKLGQFYVKTKQFDKAIQLYLKGLEIQPKSLELQTALGFAYLEKGDLDQGKKNFNVVLNSNPKSAEALAGLGLFSQMSGDLNLAQYWYEKALENEPKNITAIIFLAKLMMEKHQYDNAQKLYKKVHKIDPTAKWVELAIEDAKHGRLITQIQKLEDAKDYKTAELLWHQLILEAPNISDYYLRMGFFYQRILQYEKAIDIFPKGITVDPKSSELYAGLGLAYLSLKNWAKAEENFRTSLSLDPLNPDALAGLGYVDLMAGNLASADLLIKTALNLDPNRIAALSAMGELRMKEKKYPEAVKIYEKLLLLRPREKWIALSLDDAKYGEILDEIHDLIELENYSEAAELYLDLLTKSPSNPRYYVGLGQMYMRLKEYGKSIETNLSGLQKNPEENELRVALGYGYFFNKDLLNSQAVLEKAVKIDKKNPEALAGLGRVNALLGDYCYAETLYRQALSIDPKNQSALSFLGDLLMKEKRYTEAQEVFAYIWELLPDSEWVQRAWQDARDGPITDIANRFADSEEFEHAAVLYWLLIGSAPNDPSRYLPLGQMYVNLQNYNRGIEIYQQGLEQDPEAWYLWRAIAFAYILKEDYCYSQSIFSSLIENDPDDAESWAGLGRIQALNGSVCLAQQYYITALNISPTNLLTLSNLADLYKFEQYNFSAREIYREMIHITEEENEVSGKSTLPKWLRAGYHDILNKTCPVISVAGSYHEENQWEPSLHRWSARYLVYGGTALINYPLGDNLDIWGSITDQNFELKDLLTHSSIYSFDVQRFYLGTKWVYSPCFYIDAQAGLSVYSPYRDSSFEMLHGTIAEPSITFTYQKPIEKATLSFASLSDLVARDFSTNVAKLVGYYFIEGTYERKILKRTWIGIEGDAYWYCDFVDNNSQRVLGWLQWRPPCYSDNILFRYHAKYQTFAKNIPDYYTYKPQIVNQLQVTLEKNWRVCWADSFYTSLSYGHGWQDTRTRFAQIIVIDPIVANPPIKWDDREYNILLGNLIYKLNNLQVILNADYYKDTQKYTIWSVAGEVRWRF